MFSKDPSCRQEFQVAKGVWVGFLLKDSIVNMYIYIWRGHTVYFKVVSSNKKPHKLIEFYCEAAKGLSKLKVPS